MKTKMKIQSPEITPQFENLMGALFMLGEMVLVDVTEVRSPAKALGVHQSK